MEQISIIGLDTAKSIFQLHGDNAVGQTVFTRRLKRREVLDFLKNIPPCCVALEACGAGHYWGREIAKLGHKVKLVPPAFVKRFMTSRTKTDARDARALALAGASLELRAVPVKTVEQQAALSLLGSRRLLIRQHTQLTNSLRGQCAELGLVAPVGAKGLADLIERIESGAVELPALFTTAMAALVNCLRQLEAQIKTLSAALILEVKGNETMKRLTTAPGVGPIIAYAFAMKVPDAKRFASGRECSAWLGFTPREHSSGGKRRMLGMSKTGDEDLRTLLVQGAASLAITAKRRPATADPWIASLLKRRPFKVAIVAIAARIARTLWAMQRDASSFRLKQPATAD